jgi:hypothetical protein
MAGGVLLPPGVQSLDARSIGTPVLVDPQGNVLNTDDIVAANPKPARLRAHAEVYFAGRNITDSLDPYLISLRVTDKQEGTSHCSIVIDDRYGKFPLPDDGAQCYVKLGWPDQQSARVFNGYMSDIVSNGSRRGGRTVAVEFESADLSNAVKSSLTMSWGAGKDAPDGKSEDVPFSKVAEDVAKKAGLQLKIGGALGEVKRKFWQMGNEPPMQFLSRTAKELGGALKIEGADMPTVNCVVGNNVLAWSIRPRIARAQWGQMAHGFFDRDKAEWTTSLSEVAGGFGFGKAKAQHYGMFPVNEEAMAKTLGKSDAATSVRERGTGWIVIDGEPTAQSLASANVNGTRPGVDGGYKIIEVEHTYFRGGGWISRLDVNSPQILASSIVNGEWKPVP